MTETTIRTRAHAKLNLSLRVLAREQSGYHQIETLFCAIALADQLVVEVSDDGGIELDVAADDTGEAPDLGPMQTNLAWRAADLFRLATPMARGVRITLTKHIPHGAGLGGGSSDAAAVLRSLNTLHGRPLSEAALLQLGAQIGSDVPFFLSGAPLALGWGRGNRLLPLEPLPAATVLLAVPADKVPTADAYGALAHTRRPVPGNQALDPALVPALLRVPGAWHHIGAAGVNDFEDIVFRRIPVLAELRAAMAHARASVARLTGTGSVVFGIFENPADAAAARDSIDARFARTDQVRTIVTTTLAGGRAPGGGFEPPLADPKSAVLPLDDPGSRH